MNPKKISISKPINIPFTTYPNSIPSIYLKVSKEKQKLNNIKKLKTQTQFILKRKYFDKMLLYHRYLQLQKRILLSYKLTAFMVLKNYFITKISKYYDIIDHFDSIKKIKVFMILYKEHKINEKQTFLLKKTLRKNFLYFINTIQNNIENNYFLFHMIEKYYFRMFLKNVLISNKKNIFLSIANEKFINYKMIKNYNQIIKFLKNNIRLKMKTFYIRGKNFYNLFFKQMKYRNAFLYKNQQKTFDFKLKKFLKIFINNIKYKKNLEQKMVISILFRRDKLKQILFEKLKNHYYLIKQFKNMVFKKKEYEKLIILNKIKIEISLKKNVIKKYRKYKKLKILECYRNFFKIIKKRINISKIKYNKMISKLNEYNKTNNDFFTSGETNLINTNSILNENYMNNNINQINSQIFIQNNNEDNSKKISKKCLICNKNFQQNEDINRLECMHIFHPNCIGNWLINHNFCPECLFQVK